MPRPRRHRNAVVDNNDGSGVPSAGTTSDNALDYQPFTDIWDEDFSSGWSALADITLVDGESFLLPLEIFDNNLSEVPQTVIWNVTESGYGFTQETYTFNESDGIGFVEVSTTGTYSEVEITINDNDVIDQTLNGDATDNSLSGSNTNDAIYGEAGDDTIDGGEGDDKLFGGDVNPYDETDDEIGNDTLYGGAGNDILDGGLGSDAMFGGTGNDTYFVDDLGDTATEYPNQGVDTVNSSVSFTLGERIDNLFLTYFDNIDGTGNALNNKIVGNSGINTLFGEDGDDSLYGGFSDDYLDGGSGEDYLNGGDYNDSLYGGADNDILDGRTGNDFLSGDTGNDTLFGDVGNDYLYGGSGNDTLVSEDGNDNLDGYGWGTEFDTLTGGAGSDTFILGSSWWGAYYVEDGAGYATITDWEASIDSIELSGSSIDYRLEFQTNWVGTADYDTGIYYTGGMGSEELIGVVQDITNVDISQFTFV